MGFTISPNNIFCQFCGNYFGRDSGHFVVDITKRKGRYKCKLQIDFGDEKLYCKFHKRAYRGDHFLRVDKDGENPTYICKEYYEKENGMKVGRLVKNSKNPYTKGSQEYKRHIWLLLKYRITLDEYNRMFQEQNGCCAICGKHQLEIGKALYVDHNHETDKVRGLLCLKCNSAIGYLNEDTSIFRNGIKYLEKYK